MLAAQKFDSAARCDFFIRSSVAGDKFDRYLCTELGSLLFDFLADRNELTEDQWEIITSIEIKVFEEGKDGENLLKVLQLPPIKCQNMLIPMQENGQPYAPSSMNGSIQTEAAEEKINCNFSYAYPFGILPISPCFSVIPSLQTLWTFCTTVISIIQC